MEAILLREFARDTRFISWRTCRWPVARVFPLLGVLLNLIALSACISASAVSPERRQGSSPPHSSQTHLTFQIEPYGSGQSNHQVFGIYVGRGGPVIHKCCPGGHGGAPGIKKVFEESFASATYVLTPGSKGTHMYIEVLSTPFLYSESSALLCGLAQMSLYALPCYYDAGGVAVLYNLYIDGKFQRTYRYEITEKGVYWLPLALFIWANYFTTGETEAFEETARQFAVDAERDGYFPAPSP